MSERQWSLADRFVFVANEIARMTDDVDNENPHRYPLRKMKMTAEKILFEALTTANEICDTARVLKQELHAMDARNRVGLGFKGEGILRTKEMTPQDLIDDLRSRINPVYAAQIGTESHERRICAEALEALISERDWHPIETAPHDKRVMVWSGQETYCAHWAQNPMTGDEAWIVAEWGTEGDQALVKPTYWRPLPLPPNA